MENRPDKRYLQFFPVYCTFRVGLIAYVLPGHLVCSKEKLLLEAVLNVDIPKAMQQTCCFLAALLTELCNYR